MKGEGKAASGPVPRKSQASKGKGCGDSSLTLALLSEKLEIGGLDAACR